MSEVAFVNVHGQLGLWSFVKFGHSHQNGSSHFFPLERIFNSMEFVGKNNSDCTIQAHHFFFFLSCISKASSTMGKWQSHFLPSLIFVVIFSICLNYVTFHLELKTLPKTYSLMYFLFILRTGNWGTVKRCDLLGLCCKARTPDFRSSAYFLLMYAFPVFCQQIFLQQRWSNN